MILLCLVAVQEVRIETPVPPLTVGRAARVRVTVTNTGDAELPGGDFETGQPCTFVGLWSADAAPAVLGNFQASRRLDSPLPPGESRTIEIDYVPPDAGDVHLCAGLFAASKSGAGNRAIGGMDAEPVSVDAGRLVIRHQKGWLRTLIAVHMAAFGAGLAMLFWHGRRRP